MGKVIMSGYASNATVPVRKVISTFRVKDRQSYNFEVGMTWAQFISSKYNVNNVFYAGDSLYYQVQYNDNGDSLTILNNDGSSAKLDELIIENNVYDYAV